MSAPVFDAKTLASLTQKIQGDFKSRADPRKNGYKAKKSGLSSGDAPAASAKIEKIGKGDKRKRGEDDKQGLGGARNARAPDQSSKGQRKASFAKDQLGPSPAKKSKKSFEGSAVNVDGRKRDRKAQSFSKDPLQDLRSIVSELGGDDDDLKLIGDVESDSEMEGQTDDAQASLLKKELQDMIKSLGIPQAQAAAEDMSSSEDISEDEDEEEDQDEDKDEGEDSVHGGVDIDEADDNDDGESDLEIDGAEPQLISQVKQALEKLPERKRPKLHGLEVEPQSDWHTIDAPGISVSSQSELRASEDALQSLHEHAKALLAAENEKYVSANNTSNSANQFYATIMTSGTLSDKISALTLSVQESPLHSVRNMENLIGMAKKRNRGQALEVLGALKDLLGPGNLLPSDRRLRSFMTQPALKFVNGKDANHWHSGKPLPRPLTAKHLILWAYEDWLKSNYFEILKTLEGWLNDEITYSRSKSVDLVFGLLRDKPEQEANLLRLLINKLGDKDKQIASKASYHILQLENTHPAMKSLISSSIENDLIFRRGQSNHAKYYGIITLNQTVFSAKEEPVARQILNTYFALFMELLNKPKRAKDESAVKTVAKINSKGDSQGGGSAPGKKAQQKATQQERSAAAEDELREKMLSAVLTGVNRAIPYVDKSSDFFTKHLDTLYRITHSANFNTSIQALILIQQLSGTHEASSNRFYRTLYESLLDPRLLTSSKQALYLNLLYRSLRSDLSVKRVQAFVKRLLQITAMQQPSFACAVIYLIRELQTVFPGLAASIDQAEVDESDEEEAFYDVPDRVQEQNQEGREDVKEAAQQKRRFYDGRKRDPEHAFAEASSLWEIAPLRRHFHPSVSLFATNLSDHEKMPSKPDLSANTLIHFLDRFVYRNAKKSSSGLRGQSLMQPLAGSSDNASILVTSKDRRADLQVPVNTEGFRTKKGDSVGADEVFFHRFFNEMSKKSGAKQKKDEKKAKKAKNDEGASDASGDEDEEEIWQALVDSRPEIEGEDDDGEGWDEMDDFEEAMQDDEGEEDGEMDLAEDAGDDEDDLRQDDEDDEDEGDAFDFDDEDDLLGSDDELPEEFIPAVSKAGAKGDEEEDDDDNDVSKSKGKKKPNRRRMLKSLPMFAAVEDYAAMLQSDDDEF